MNRIKTVITIFTFHAGLQTKAQFFYELCGELCRVSVSCVCVCVYTCARLKRTHKTTHNDISEGSALSYSILSKISLFLYSHL
jgi:hypothetical protein